MGRFSDAALLLIGHGSSFDPEAAAPIFQHGAELRRRGLFAQVTEAFLKQASGLQGLLETIQHPRVFIVPMLMSEGYFTSVAIPEALGLRKPEEQSLARVQHRGAQTIHYGSALGTHPALTELILSRAAEVVDKHPFPRRPPAAQTALFVAGHGTARHENSRRAVLDHVQAILDQKQYPEVHGLFLEEAPSIREWERLSQARYNVIVPFFLSEGPHTRHDIPIELGEAARVVEERIKRGQPSWRNPTERSAKLVWYAQSVGTDPRLAEVICARVEEAAATLPAD